jgi:phytoene dehydrogenase-like protein
MRSNRTYDAVVVGSGPNGLAAGITIAREGRSVLVLEASGTIGGGVRTRELTLPGFRHDVCSAVHPLALVSPFFRSLDLGAHGLEWIQPPLPLAHPLDESDAVTLNRSMDMTAAGLGRDFDRYRELIGPGLQTLDGLIHDLLRPLGLPRHPAALLRFATRGLRPASGLARTWFKEERARALFAGNSAHSILPLEDRSTASFGLLLCTLGHAVGWPIARRGSQAIGDALASIFRSWGGTIEVDTPVSSIDDLPRARVYLFDVTPRQFARIAGQRLPTGYRERLEGHRHGPGVFKVDWALDQPIPWKAPVCALAGTLHLGGTLEEIASSERDTWRGIPSEKPFVLLNQPSLFDPSRAPEGKHTVWAYCHVPNGCAVDMTDRIEGQVERFAPGFRDRIIARHVMSPADMEDYNPNYRGGDIAGGVQGFGELFLRPMGRWRAYSTPVKGLYICSSSMPPGAGVHGMCGHLAAKRALRDLL